MLLVATAHAKPGECVVAGRAVTLQEVEVKAPGEEPFHLGLQSLPALAHLPARCGAPIQLDVGGAIVFSASRDHVRLTISRDITTPDRLVTLSRGATMIDACVRGDRVFGSAILEEDDVLEGEHKPADQVIKNVEVPCDALSLDAIALDEKDYFIDAAQATHAWELRNEEASSLALYVQPNTNASARLYDTPSCSGCIHQLWEVKRTKNWVLVEVAQWGVRARGWVRRSLIRQLPDDDYNIYGGVGCWGDHGRDGFWGESPDPNSVEREGTVRIGTTVYAGDGTSPWGTFARDEHVKVRITQGSLWAELRSVPGLDGDPSGSPFLHGNVRLDAVKLDPTP
jgi:hypothetical protein